MSWLRRRSPVPARRPTGDPRPLTDQAACLEALQCHWTDALAIMRLTNIHNNPRIPATADDVESVCNYVQKMAQLLLEEGRNGELHGPMLDLFMTEGILEEVFLWCNSTGEFANRLKLEQLHIYELLIVELQHSILVHKPILRPLLKLLQVCGERSPVDVERSLVSVLNHICMCVSQYDSLLEFFFNAATDTSASKFLVFSILTQFLHRDGAIGEQARNSLLHCMVLSAKFDYVGAYIADESNFCPVLATGLSGLYSRLPRKLEALPEDWHELRDEDKEQLPELETFLGSLEFCNAVVQVAHAAVRDQLIDYVYHGFLVCVMGPALCQELMGIPYSLRHTPYTVSSTDEVVMATAYLKLFISNITDKALMKTFLRFLLVEKLDGAVIIDSIVSRINNSDRLCLVSLSLIHTLLSLNCEEVMLHLVLRHLIPCSHVMVSQIRSLKTMDTYGSSAEKLLSLVPSCCVPALPPIPATPPVSPIDASAAKSLLLRKTNFSQAGFRLGGSRGHHGDARPASAAAAASARLGDYETDYVSYLRDAHAGVGACARACAACWSAPYDGMAPPPDAVVTAAAEAASEAKHAVAVVKHGGPEDEIEEDEVRWRPERVVNGTVETPCEAPVVAAAAAAPPRSRDDSLCDGEVALLSERMALGADLPLVHDWRRLSSEQFESALCRVRTPEGAAAAGDLEESLNEIEAVAASLQLDDETPASSIDDDEAADLSLCLDCEAASAFPPNGEADAHTQSALSQSVLCPEEGSDSLPGGAPKSCQEGQQRRDGAGVMRSKDDERDAGETSAVVRDASSTAAADTPVAPPVAANCDLPGIPSTPLSPVAARFGNPDIGPLFTTVFRKLDNMMENTFYVNLHVTAVVARLACYPQPLMRSFLLNHNLVCQPSVRSLSQVLASVKQQVDSYSHTVGNFDQLLVKARKYLVTRDKVYFEENSSPGTGNRGRGAGTLDGKKVAEKKKGLTNFRFWKQSIVEEEMSPRQELETIPDNKGYRYINRRSSEPPSEGKLETMQLRKAVFCAIVLEEFLKELAAISQEHVALQNNSLDSDL
ncbi:PREDICTED: FTS and Hook-interacting protein-like [Priapulus caudatus]|uniref:FTS and Hook-interacting protein-like n=1 Tax=Priapulus caudatus TaxID=37621 RepID=A0ABM1EMH6_PRICU|nr:PREDICTED: FTS and Hook-interacting protein-like [Priapulus caudatus]